MGDLDIADVAKYVRELWVDRLQSTEELTVENNLSLEEALQVRLANRQKVYLSRTAPQGVQEGASAPPTES